MRLTLPSRQQTLGLFAALLSTPAVLSPLRSKHRDDIRHARDLWRKRLCRMGRAVEEVGRALRPRCRLAPGKERRKGQEAGLRLLAEAAPCSGSFVGGAPIPQDSRGLGAARGRSGLSTPGFKSDIWGIWQLSFHSKRPQDLPGGSRGPAVLTPPSITAQPCGAQSPGLQEGGG